MTGLAGVILFFATVKLGDAPPTVSDSSILHLKLQGDLTERPPVEMPPFLADDQMPMSLAEFWSAMRRATNDPKIKGVLLEPVGVSTGWAKLGEMRDAVANFKKSGKPVYAFLRYARTGDYYLATAADKIYIANEALLDVKGVRVELAYFKGLLEKVGVKVDFENAGKYKDFGDAFTRTSASPETREVMNSILDHLYGDLAKTIAGGRKKSVEEVKALIDQGPFLTDKAKELGLVDEVAYEDKVLDDLKAKAGVSEIKKIHVKDYARASAGGTRGSARIAYLVAEGAIGGAIGPDMDDGITAPSMIRWMKQIEKDSSIQGVILRVDSPGGDAFASDEILHQARLLSKKKPLIVSMGDYAASGGYMISMTGDPVLAHPNTVTGSIGVFYGRVNLKGLYDKVGVNKEMLSRGRFAGADSDYFPLDEAGKAKLRESVDETYKNFLTVVAEGRKKKTEEIHEVAQGRVWMGSQAKDKGLVDELGGLDRAVEMIRAKAKIAADKKIALVPYPDRKTFFEVLLGRGKDAAVGGADVAVAERALLRQLFPRRVEREWFAGLAGGGGGLKRLLPVLVELR